MESVVDAAPDGGEPVGHRQGSVQRLLGAARGLPGVVAQALYPPVCVACGAATEGDWSLCGPCWREAEFLAGALVCDACGVPLPGRDDEAAHCDDCLRRPRPWTRGRAALPYRGTCRVLVLALKHSDRTELAKPLGLWLAAAARPIRLPDQVLGPVPLHWTRLLRRRQNQAQFLASEAGRVLGLPVLPDALVRRKATKSLGHGGRDARAKAMEDAIAPHPRRGAALAGRPVLLADDVMTSGATLAAAAATAARAAGATDVRILVVARALLDPGREGELWQAVAVVPRLHQPNRRPLMATIEIYTSPTCGYCHAAKRLLAQKGASYSEVDVVRHPERRAEMMQRANGRRTVPQIFIDGKHVGGCDDLYALDDAGKLDSLLAA